MSDALKTTWFVGTLMVFAYLVLRNVGLQPEVMADEWYYSSYSRLMPLAEVAVPSYLYFALFKTTAACGPGFLECARIFNALIFVAAAPFIYLTGRRFMSPALASAVALLAVLGPLNGYTAYFMPESLYFLGFWLLSWSAFRFHEQPNRARAVNLGAVLGALFLIKVHAVFLFPGIALFMAYSVYSHAAPGTAKMARAAMLVALAVLTALVLRFGIGYLCAGRTGLSLFGTLYDTQAANSTGNRARITELLGLVLFNLRGHVIGLTLLFGVPLAVLTSQLVGFRHPATAPRQRALALYASLMLLALLGMTVVFTAFVAGSGYESNMRLHMRYYNFVFPLLTMAVAACIDSQSLKLPRTLTLGIVIPIACVMLYGALTHWRPYTPSFVDTPEFQGMTSQIKVFRFLSVLALVSLVCWAFNQKLGARLFLGLFMPLLTILASIAINHEIKNNGSENKFDRAAIVAKAYLSEPQRARVGIVSDDVSGMFRTKFHLDSTKVWQHVLADGAPVEAGNIPAGIDWLLVFGAHPLPPGAAVHVKHDEFSLVELNASFPGQLDYDFSAGPGGILERTTGLSGVEPWGRWSDQKIVTLQFAKALPRHFKLVLLAEAYGPNAGEDVVVRVGSQSRVVKVQKAKTNVEAEFDTDGQQNSITFEIPKPASPRSLGMGQDERTLGIGFSKLRIDTRAAATANQAG